jgi:hypothetical protein
LEQLHVHKGGQAVVGYAETSGALGGGLDKNPRNNPMNPKPTLEPSRALRLQRASRCHATSKHTRQRCQAPAERGKRVCRFHGARAGVPIGNSNALICGKWL